MDPYTVLDVVRYENYRTKYHARFPEYIILQFVSTVLCMTRDHAVKETFKDLGELMMQGYGLERYKKRDARLITIPFIIARDEWLDDEYIWYTSNIKIVKETSFTYCCGACNYDRMVYVKEMFHVFCEILRQKFPDDANMICVMDDVLKRYIL
jgi:hypothetical protein